MGCRFAAHFHLSRRNTGLPYGVFMCNAELIGDNGEPFAEEAIMKQRRTTL